MITGPLSFKALLQPAYAPIVTFLTLVAVAVGPDRHARAEVGAEILQASRPPILVELFTSQGCSSCPPADRLLSRLASSDSSIVTLAFHVDYWNYIGWTDPFSSSAWSERQRRYAAKLGADHVYTPQIVVNGRRHGVGSDQAEIAKLLAEASDDASGLALRLDLVAAAPDSLEVRLTVDSAETQRDGSWLARVALLENDLDTPVGRGENARRTLHNDRVVRRMVSANVETVDHSATSIELTIDIEPAWQRDKLRLAAFLQDPDSLWVHAATTLPGPF